MAFSWATQSLPPKRLSFLTKGKALATRSRSSRSEEPRDHPERQHRRTSDFILTKVVREKMDFRPNNRYDQYCTKYGCFSGVTKDDFENPWPSIAYTGFTTYPDPRVHPFIRDAFCGPSGCAAGPLPVFPASALKSQDCLSCKMIKQECTRS